MTGMMSKFAIPSTDRWVVLEHAALVSIAAGLTFLAENLSKTDFGVYTPLVVAVASLVTAYINKVIHNPETPDPAPAPYHPPAPEPYRPPTPPPDNGGEDFPL